MKKIITLTLAACHVAAMAAMTEAQDSIGAQELQEVVIEAPKVIRKSDMDVYHPSQSAVDNSKNGMQLLTNLMSSGR